MKKTVFITQAAVIAALYVVLTLLANALGLANYAVQVRFSEALTILPFFTPAAIPGLFVGCIISNVLGGCIIWDVIFGSMATLIGAVGTYLIAHAMGGKATPSNASVADATGASDSHSSLVREICCTLPPIAANAIIVPFVLAYAYHFEGTIPYFMLTVGAGEVISCGILGILLLKLLKKYRNQLFQ